MESVEDQLFQNLYNKPCKRQAQEDYVMKFLEQPPNKNLEEKDFPNAFLKDLFICYNQRWSLRGRPWPRERPRGQILKSLTLALASKVKSLASRPQVLENWPVLGSRTALFFELLKFCGALENFSGKRFFVEIA